MTRLLKEKVSVARARGVIGRPDWASGRLPVASNNKVMGHKKEM